MKYYLMIFAVVSIVAMERENKNSGHRSLGDKPEMSAGDGQQQFST
jgi:hypothetical protein